MWKVQSIRIKILVGLILASAKVSFDLLLHKSTAVEIQDGWQASRVESISGTVHESAGASRSLSTVGTSTIQRSNASDNSFIENEIDDPNNRTEPIALTSLNNTSVPKQNSSTPSSEPIVPSLFDNTTSPLHNSSSFPSAVEFVPTNYAYAYVIGGCNPENGHYKGFLYNILVSSRILREEGSQADIVAFFQMSFKSNATELPNEDVRFLTSLGVKIEYIPKSEMESFYETVINKFRILSLVQYRRVLLMDGDVMPIGNLDYLFEMSDGPNATLKENVIVAGMMEPANAGFFMLAPGLGEYERLMDIVNKREVEANELKGPKFDQVKGWGHVIAEDDQWETRKGPGGTMWNFHFAFSDQGLLYHWTKYVKQNVSIVSSFDGKNHMVQNWGPSPSGKTVLVERLPAPFQNRSKPRFKSYRTCNKFMCDFIHFTGKGKPWMHPPPSNITFSELKKDVPSEVWWHTLYTLNNELGMGLNFTHWTPHGPPLGLIATFKDLNKRVEKRNK